MQRTVSPSNKEKCQTKTSAENFPSRGSVSVGRGFYRQPGRLFLSCSLWRTRFGVGAVVALLPPLPLSAGWSRGKLQSTWKFLCRSRKKEGKKLPSKTPRERGGGFILQNCMLFLLFNFTTGPVVNFILLIFPRALSLSLSLGYK